MYFLNNTATTEIDTLSLHDALPILLTTIFVDADRPAAVAHRLRALAGAFPGLRVSDRSSLVSATDADREMSRWLDRKSTRLNSQSRQYLVCRLLLEKKMQPEATAN